MITALAQQVQTRLALVSQLEMTRNELNNIEATLAELDKVDEEFQKIDAAMRTVQDRLLFAALANIAVQSSRIADDLERSRISFATSRRQVQDLKTVQRRMQELRTTLSQAWYVYADDQIRPGRELLGLVTNLPEIAAQMAEIDRLIDQLEAHQQAPPSSETELARFDERLRDLDGRPAAVRQLDPEVKHFLDKVRVGTATVADLTPSILAWCQAAQRASAFAISFRKQPRV